jgi:hypothetical protein
MARIKWNNVASDVRRMARELVEDPEYRAALHRRLADGKAPRMMRLLLQWADTKSRDPAELQRGKPTLTVATKHLPGDPAGDPMREQTQRMIEAKAREEEARARQEEDARARQAAGDRPAAARPEEPSDPDQLEVYGDPPDREPYYPDR